MALSCVYRTGQRFGAGHVIDVLRGADNERVRRFQHNALSTYGIGDKHSDAQWRSIFRALIARGYLMADAGRFGALRLTARSREVLKAQVQLLLREESKGAKSGSTRAQKRRNEEPLHEDDEPLWDMLREYRLEEAQAQGVPPYVIFHDGTLHQLVKRRPQTMNDLLQVHGIGQAKADRYGDDLLAIIASA